MIAINRHEWSTLQDNVYGGSHKITKVFVGSTQVYPEGEPACEECLTFTSVSEFTLETANRNFNWNGVLEYSYDKIVWERWSGMTVIPSRNGVIYLRGFGNSYITGSSTTSGRFILSGNDDIYCIGNIETILNYTIVQAGGHVVMSSNCFNGLFYNNVRLVSAPDLPAPEIPMRGYAQMFSGCTGLIAAPEIGATIVGTQACNSMFMNCTSMKTPPSILRSIDAKAMGVYYRMFYGCSALESAPIISSLSVGQNGFQQMFYGCSSLAAGPALHPTSLSMSCYREMFRLCTSLTTMPYLPATVLTDYCYYQMFATCSSLEVIQGNADPQRWPYQLHLGVASGNSPVENMFTGTVYAGASPKPWQGTPNTNYGYFTNYPLVRE